MKLTKGKPYKIRHVHMFKCKTATCTTKVAQSRKRSRASVGLCAKCRHQEKRDRNQMNLFAPIP